MSDYVIGLLFVLPEFAFFGGYWLGRVQTERVHGISQRHRAEPPA